MPSGCQLPGSNSYPKWLKSHSATAQHSDQPKIIDAGRYRLMHFAVHCSYYTHDDVVLVCHAKFAGGLVHHATT